jgi:hypothetical protein
VKDSSLEQGSAEEPMPFAADLLAGVEILFSLAAFAVVTVSILSAEPGSASGGLYARAFREPGPTAVALLAGPPIVVAIGLFLRKPWGRYAAILLHVSLGACAVWQFVLRLSPTPSSTVRSPDSTIAMLFLFALSIGVPLFLRRKHLRAAFARGRR